MAEIPLYGPIDSYSATSFIEKMNEAENGPDKEIVVRLNTGGGSPEYGWGMVSKFSECKKPKVVKVDGKAHSMGAFFCCYAPKVEAVDTAEFLIHRAAYPKFIEDNKEYFDDAMRGNLVRVNNSLRAAFEAKVNPEKFESIKGVKLDDIFSMDKRIDCFVTAAEAKEMGLIDKVIPLTPIKRAEIESLAQSFGFHAPIEIAANQTQNQTPNTMNLQELKEKHPSVFAEAVAIGATQERERAEAWAHFADVDAKGVQEGIKAGKTMTQLQMIEFTQKRMNTKELSNIGAEGAEAVKTAAEKEAEKTAAEKAETEKNEKFAKALDASLFPNKIEKK